MTLEELQSQWPGLSADGRFAAFVEWIETELASVLDLIGPLGIERHAAANPVSFSPPSDYRVDPDLFGDSDPVAAIAVGSFIVAHALQAAQDAWYGNQKKQKELEKERQKFLDKLWEKLLKDAKPKGDPGYAQWYYSYYLPNLYGEYGSP